MQEHHVQRLSLPVRPISLAIALALASLCAAAQSTPPSATAAPVQSLDIPAQPAAQALQRLVELTKLQLVYSPDVVRNVTTKAVQGSFTAKAALTRMLEGSGLEVVDTGVDAVTIRPTDAASGHAREHEALQPVLVTGISHLASTARTGTRTDADPMTLPMSITAVDKDLLAQQQSLTLRDAVTNVAGVNEVDGNGAYTMRGFAAGVMRNGNLVASPTGIDVPLMAISRLEVVKGPEAIIAGQSAGYGGVINVISKTPQVAPITEVAGTVGSHGYYELGADIGRALDANKTLLGRVVVSKQGSGVNHYGYDGPNSDYIAPSLTWRNKSTRTEITAQYEYQNKRTPAQPTVLTDQPSLTGDLKPFRAGPASEGVDSRSRVATLAVNQSIANGWEVGLNYVDERRFNTSTSTFTFPGAAIGLPPPAVVAFGQAGDSTYNSKSAKLELKGEVETGPLQHKLLFAYDQIRRTHESGQASTSLTSVNPDTGEVTDLVPIFGAAFGVPSPRVAGGTDPVETGILVMDQVQWGDWVALGGWRSMTFKPRSRQADLPEFKRSLPSLGLLYRVSPSLSLYGSVSKGFTPNSGNVSFDGASVPPEDAQQSELGVKWLIPEHKVAMTAAVFDIKQKNVAISDPLHPGIACGTNVCYVSVPGIHSQGAEIEVSGQVAKGLDVRANYTYLHKESDTPNLPNPSWARHQLNLWATYRFSGDEALGWWVGGGVQARSARNVAVGSANNPGNGRVDLSAGYDTKGWSVVGGVKNAGDKQLYTLQSGLFNLGAVYQPREFFLTARYRFE
jgi:iron complex outermembrane receptor protein